MLEWDLESGSWYQFPSSPLGRLCAAVSSAEQRDSNSWLPGR